MKWTIQEKIQTDPPLIWNEDMEFPGVSKKQHVKFPGECVWNFQGFAFGLGISKGSNTILWNIARRLSFVLSGISRGKVKKMKNSSPEFSKMWNFQGLIKNEVEFPRVSKK